VNTLMTGISRGLMTRYAFMAAAKARLISNHRKYDLGLVARPHYAYGILGSAAEAKKLGYSGMTILEFGVAGGNGLLTMEEYAKEAERRTGIEISIVGFDSGEGLPAPVDYRDVPFLWDTGDFAMDQGALRSRLTRSELVLGDVRETTAAFVAELNSERPIGFVSFDLDFWSSTVAAFDVFRGRPEACLPRVWCYFDDIVALVEDLGELLAIREFNEEPHGRRIRHPWMLRGNVPFQPWWADQMFQAHLFDHPRYSLMQAEQKDRELPLLGN
jgi:hypothetical protein